MIMLGRSASPAVESSEDDADAVATALREAHEEIGLPPSSVDVVGTLPEYLTATGYKVTPVIGLIERPFSPVLDSFEVSEVFEVPAAVPDGPDQSRTQNLPVGRQGSHVLCDAVCDTRASCSGSTLFHLGRNGRDPAQPISIPARSVTTKMIYSGKPAHSRRQRLIVGGCS